MTEMSQHDFERLYTFIQTNYGIDLSKKKALVESRLANELIAQGYTTFHDFVEEILSKQNPELNTTMLNKLTTNYTYFFREQEHFDYLKEVILPKLKKKHEKDRVISIWSAGCSSGEEPYSLSITLKEFFGKEAPLWDTRILATDISQNILESAMNPVYDDERLEKVPPLWKEKYFIRQPNNTWTVSPTIRNNVIFKKFNLMTTPTWKRPFDLILCRNVMIYFDQSTKKQLVKRFYNVTVDDGYLFVGHAESLGKANCPYDYIMPAIYHKKGS